MLPRVSWSPGKSFGGVISQILLQIISYYICKAVAFCAFIYQHNVWLCHGSSLQVSSEAKGSIYILKSVTS